MVGFILDLELPVVALFDRKVEFVPGARLRSSNDDLRSPLIGVSRFVAGCLERSREGRLGVS